MSQPAGRPEQPEEAWLTKCKAETLKSSEWRELVAAVFKETKVELSKRHIVFFSELTHEEKADCMEDVQAALKGSREFQKMLVMLRHSVDVGLSEAITAEMAAGKHPASATKIDVLMDKASTAATSLLADWPRNQQHLGLMLNRSLTGSLRRPAWELLLSRKDARAHYEAKIAKQPSSTISGKDLEILQKCQRLLVSDFGSVAASSRLVVTVMKTAVSYCHVLSKNDDFVSETSELLPLLVPLLAVFQDSCAAGDAKTVIERYIALLVVLKPGLFSEYSSLMTAPAPEAFEQVLHQRDAQLHSHLAAVSPEEGGAPVPGGSVLLAVMDPLSRALFVGFTSLDVVYFIWDQCLLSGFNLLPAITSAVVTLAREPLLEAATREAVHGAITSTAAALTVAALQRELEARYEPELKAAGMPSWEAKLAPGPDAPLLFGDDILDRLPTPPPQRPAPAQPPAPQPASPPPRAPAPAPSPPSIRTPSPAPAPAEEPSPSPPAQAPTPPVQPAPQPGRADSPASLNHTATATESRPESAAAGMLLTRMLTFKKALQKGTEQLDPLISNR